MRHVVLIAAGAWSFLGCDTVFDLDYVTGQDPAPDARRGDGAAGSITLTFRHGENGYAGAQDTTLSLAAPGTILGNEPGMVWELDDAPPQNAFALVRFDDVFGTSPDRVPPNTPIDAAQLAYTVFDSGDLADIHEVLIPWTQGAATYDNFGTASGAQSALDYDSAVIARATSSVGTHTIDVTTSLNRWSADTRPNHGWIFVPTGTNGVRVYTSEAPLALRPQLVVTFQP